MIFCIFIPKERLCRLIVFNIYSIVIQLKTIIGEIRHEKKLIYILLTNNIIAYEICYMFYLLLNRNDLRVRFAHGESWVRDSV